MIEGTKRWCRRSVTIFWARLLQIFGLVMETAFQVADLANLPGIKEQIQAIFPQKYWPIYLIVIGVTTELSRRRTLNRE